VVCGTADLSQWASSNGYSSYTPPTPCLDEVSLVCCTY
jgi:hypothetical protein